MATVQPISHRVNAFKITPHNIKSKFTQEKNTELLSMPSSPEFETTAQKIKYIHQLAQLIDQIAPEEVSFPDKSNGYTGQLVDLRI